jgi:hypothetical protein
MSESPDLAFEIEHAKIRDLAVKAAMFYNELLKEKVNDSLAGQLVAVYVDAVVARYG